MNCGEMQKWNGISSSIYFYNTISSYICPVCSCDVCCLWLQYLLTGVHNFMSEDDVYISLTVVNSSYNSLSYVSVRVCKINTC
jgi:hypothetical protein